MPKFTLEEWKKLKSSEYKEEVELDDEKPSYVSQRSNVIEQKDHSRLRHNRSRYEGFQIGCYMQSPPMLFTRDGHNVFLGDMYRGASAFLILGGPSFLNVDKNLLKSTGVLTMGVNNSPASFRPNLWLSVDNPQSFIMSIWLDPTIMKFVPYAHAEKKLFDNNSWKMTNIKVGQCPNVFYYRRNEHFQAKQFLLEDTFNWGNHSNLCHCGYWRDKDEKVKVCPECGEESFGSRSVMLPAIRMLFFLGIRNVFLLGCDFSMQEGSKNYHFDQDRSRGSVRGNNGSYRSLVKRFEELLPVFQKMGLQVFNCNPDSQLNVFPKVSYEDAIKAATSQLPDINNERTEGLYDRKKE